MEQEGRIWKALRKRIRNKQVTVKLQK